MGDPIEIEAILSEARKNWTQKELADLLGVDAKTVSRWETGKNLAPRMVGLAIRELMRKDVEVPKSPRTPSVSGGDFTFIDLFAGIGGIRLGFERQGGKCVFTSEWNTFSQKTYVANFGDEHEVNGDITKIEASDVPDHDVLLAGFPCQPFSIAGVSKKNSLGRAHGFACDTQGTLFFDVARILEEKRPKAFLLENVKNLVSHDKGRTFSVIMRTLREELGYHVEARVIDAKRFVPQHRERIVIVGFREDVGFSFDDLDLPNEGPRLASILHPEDGSESAEAPFTAGPKAKVSDKYVLSDKLWAYLKAYADKHKAAGNGFGFGLVTPDMVSRTLSARYHKDGSEILVSRGKKNPRRLTPRECARLMGFPDDWKIPVSDTQAYRQFGNAVAVPVFEAVAALMKPRVMALAEKEAGTPRLFAA
ncbi:DNA (cytosine-5)-methyltransferase 1 [Cupriavidus sp. OV038]|uniref:DNA (cytosine-5-)-methyltransferase n=1 Tax=unclassified Cupriavidus TaxID=2640874 RepID=UPI0008E8D373|nr:MULTISPECIES: DNA (cytosine-5-)-methyltransferase [unclassified Cupriavidus]SFB69078.1 DNA (cytosine-5)-methyltransferase 1 [Cupriavidus sp. OV038]SFO58487.1 DNA (cytosine-5)-methyltransferase 1 [Cupriavidus sp. OV096]